MITLDPGSAFPKGGMECERANLPDFKKVSTGDMSPPWFLFTPLTSSKALGFDKQKELAGSCF
jgi:hypothetical protein